MLWFLSAQQSASVSFSVLFSFYSHQHFHQTVGYLYSISGAFLAKEPLSSLRNWRTWTQLQINDHAASPGGRCSSTNRPKSRKYWWIIVLRQFFWVMDWLMSLSLLFFSHWEQVGVQYLAQGHFSMKTAGAGGWTTDHLSHNHPNTTSFLLELAITNMQRPHAVLLWISSTRCWAGFRFTQFKCFSHI